MTTGKKTSKASGQPIKKIVEKGYQPATSIDPKNPPQGKKSGGTQAKKG